MVGVDESEGGGAEGLILCGCCCFVRSFARLLCSCCPSGRACVRSYCGSFALPVPCPWTSALTECGLPLVVICCWFFGVVIFVVGPLSVRPPPPPTLPCTSSGLSSFLLPPSSFLPPRIIEPLISSLFIPSTFSYIHTYIHSYSCSCSSSNLDHPLLFLLARSLLGSPTEMDGFGG